MNKLAENLLAPFGWIFGGVVKTRRKFYENGVFQIHDLGVPVVSVGNLTVGGTGKTPLVVYIAKILAANNHKVCVLTRGYKRRNPNERVLVSDGEKILADAKTSGDEPFEVANKMLGVAAVIADKRRAAAGIWAKSNLGITAFVLDDAFQHWQIKRDVDVVCVDATNPFGSGKLLPAGILREPLTSLKRADCVVLTRTDLSEEVQSPKSKVQNLKSKIQNLTDSPILLAKTKIVGLSELGGNPKSKIQNPKSKTAFAFCALGNPENFFESLRRGGFQVAGTKSFPDHYGYNQTDIEKVEIEAQKSGAEILLTTAKDAVKLADFDFNLPCFVVEIETVFDDDKLLREMLVKL